MKPIFLITALLLAGCTTLPQQYTDAKADAQELGRAAFCEGQYMRVVAQPVEYQRAFYLVCGGGQPGDVGQ